MLSFDSMLNLHRPDSTEREEYLRDFAALRIKGAKLASTGVLQIAMRTVAEEDAQAEIKSTKKNLDFFSKNGGAEALVFHRNRFRRYSSCALSRLLPVPGEVGFLAISSAKRYCGVQLTKGTVTAFRTDSAKHLLYVQSVKQFMDDFSIPSSSRDPTDARAELLKLFEEVKEYAKYGVVKFLYRLLASTFFLDPDSHRAIGRVFTEDIAMSITKKFPKHTHSLKTVVNYSAFISSLQELAKFYGTVSDSPDKVPVSARAEATELRHANASKAAHSLITETKRGRGRIYVSANSPDQSSRSSPNLTEVSTTRSNSPDIRTHSPASSISLENAPVVFTFPRVEDLD
jgi:hypothetical protein